MKGLLRPAAALALALALLVALAAPTAAAPATPTLPVTGTVINSNELTGTFVGTFTPSRVAVSPDGQLVLSGTLTGTVWIGEAVYPLVDQPFTATVTPALDEACTTLTLTFGVASLGVEDLALALDPATVALPEQLPGRGRLCKRASSPDDVTTLLPLA